MDVKESCPGQGFGRGIIFYQTGYSLVEILVVLTISAILVSAVFPDLTKLVARERTTVLHNTLVGELALARAEAVMRHYPVVLCQSNNGQTCQRSGNWHNGWLVFVDHNNNKQHEPHEKILRIQQGVGNGTSLRFRGSFGIRHYLKYKPDGRVFPNGSFLICHPQNGTGKAIVITQSGRVRLSKKQTNGAQVQCN